MSDKLKVIKKDEKRSERLKRLMLMQKQFHQQTKQLSGHIKEQLKRLLEFLPVMSAGDWSPTTSPIVTNTKAGLKDMKKNFKRNKKELRKDLNNEDAPTNSMGNSSSISGPINTFDPILGKKKVQKRLRNIIK